MGGKADGMGHRKDKAPGVGHMRGLARFGGAQRRNSKASVCTAGDAEAKKIPKWSGGSRQGTKNVPTGHEHS